eukprot:m.60985 g.60985  ORF g.60985 m.60985 type:complete len:277 (+) comp11370_c0_seq1:159-989(+)
MEVTYSDVIGNVAGIMDEARRLHSKHDGSPTLKVHSLSIDSNDLDDSAFAEQLTSSLGLLCIESIIIKRNNLTSVPNILNCQQQHLLVLIVSNNLLHTIPEAIGDFKSLQTLCLNNNCINEIPDTISNLQHLKVLNLSDNNITHVPDALSECISLQRLSLRQNRLSTFPDTMYKLEHLTMLDLSHNKINKTPDVIASFFKLRLLLPSIFEGQKEKFKKMLWTRRRHKLLGTSFNNLLSCVLLSAQRMAVYGRLSFLPVECWELVFQFLSGKDFLVS